MDRGHRDRACRRRALSLALIGLELVAQVLSLSLLPSDGTVGGLCPVSGRAELWNTRLAARLSGSPPVRFLEMLVSAARPAAPDREDDESEQADWPQVELIVRQKAPTTAFVPALAPSHGLSVVRSACARPRIQGRQMSSWITHLSRLTC
jgi:hypothetical protein